VKAAWLRLLAAADRGHRVWLEALKRAGSADRLLGMNATELDRVGLNRELQLRLRNCAHPPRAWHDWLEPADHHLIPFGTAGYPAQLAEIDDAPLALWAVGHRIDALSGPQLAIVGSRNPTRTGRLLAESFAASLSSAGLCITSGLALGIDAASHRGAMTGIGGTVAVLGNGIDRTYPASHGDLAAEIVERGCVVSEYGPGTPVRAFQFPRRNRIIAGLSLGTLVVEATRKSGALITAQLAANNGREVFAIPGSIHSPLSRGCHKLLRDGARLVEETDDVIAEIAPQLRAAAGESTPREDPDGNSALPSELQDCLDFSPITLDELVQATGLTAGELSSMLLHLEIQGKIEALAGGRYCRLTKRA
jgi:DNA processing protein